MPGHKGKGIFGAEKYDITEIDGADSLFHASGIIAESERNASAIFGCDTYYSTEGSSLAVRAIVYLLCLYAKEKGIKPLIFAGRNAHKSFVSAVALTGAEVEWLYGGGYLDCNFGAGELDEKLSSATEKPVAVYITSPDYLGNIADVKKISEVCKKHGVLLAVDNAHGAYLKFLAESEHPTDLGADICCDSAHKTLPVLTGGAYLHLSRNSPDILRKNAKNALSLFATSSPSYLILASLDAANAELENGFSERLSKTVEKAEKLKKKLKEAGFTLCGTEPLKITVKPKFYGYTGYGLNEKLKEKNAYCDYCDKDDVVMMLGTDFGDREYERIYGIFRDLPKKTEIYEKPPEEGKYERAVSIRDAAFAPGERISVGMAKGRIYAGFNEFCPPAVPIVVAGERIDGNAIERFSYYGINEIEVLK